MSVLSELSSILTNANWAMYRTGMEEALHVPSSGPVELLGLNMPYSTNTPETQKWYHLAPQHWTKQHVLEWISSHVEESQFNVSFLNIACCSIDGPTLCQLSHDELLAMFGSLGHRLHQSLQEINVKNCADDLNAAWDILDELFNQPVMETQTREDYKLLSTVVVQDDQKSNDLMGYQDVLKMTGGMTPQSDNGYESGSASLDSSYARNLNMPSSPDSGSLDSDPEFCAAKFSLPAVEHIKVEKEQTKTHKRGRGRPRKTSHSPGHFLETTKSKHSPRGAHLWEFIRDILIHPELNHGLMKWEDRKEGIFKFLKSEAVAQLWGQKKRNSSMTYEKLSRAMRYYYKREILERVDGRRLVYKFGRNSSGWKVEEKGLIL